MKDAWSSWSEHRFFHTKCMSHAENIDKIILTFECSDGETIYMTMDDGLMALPAYFV